MRAMTTPGPLLNDASEFDAAALRAVIGIRDGLAAVVCIARVLVEHGRAVDLTGLERGVGLLVAKTLDLPHEQGRSLRPLLVALRDEVDSLATAIRRVERD
jgi:hypothetical protein